MFELLAPLYDAAMRRLGADYSRAVSVLGVTSSDLVVDIGGGTGLGALAAIRNVGCRAVLVDMSPAMLRHGRCGDGVLCLRGDAERLPLRSATVDGALLLDALHHFRRPQAGLAEIARILKPGRSLALVELDGRHPASKILAVLERLAGEPGTVWSPEELTRMTRAAGLAPTIASVDGFGVLIAAERPGIM